METSSDFTNVVVCSGHMIDAPDRKSPRFPPTQEATVRQHIAKQLEIQGIGAGDLGICGGARGADILFAECCLERGARVSLLIPRPDERFIPSSIHLPGSDWEARYRALGENPKVTKLFQEEQLGPLPADVSVYVRNNQWIIDTARTTSKRGELFAILVWDERDEGDGPGGTADFARQIEKAGGRIAIINPTQL